LLLLCYILPVRQFYIGGANVPAPSKRAKQSAKHGAHNKGARTRLRNLSKNFYRAIEAGDEETARQLRDESQREYDKAASRGIIHPNRAARKVSRLDKALATVRGE
jgi:small subunit ribosomal protein S20